jgi:hypothetical protein
MAVKFIPNAIKYTDILNCKTQIWIFGLKMYHLATLVLVSLHAALSNKIHFMVKSGSLLP